MSSAFSNSFITVPLRALAIVGLKLSGWKVDLQLPLKAPFVCIGAPHTSNWDFILLLATALIMRMDVRWLGKDSLFRFPFRSLMLWLGGIPTDRSKAGNQVANAAQVLLSQPGLVLCVAPEGTRSKVSRWKTGFYHIAVQAQVPILMALIDSSSRTVRLLGVHKPQGNADEEIAQIQALYGSYKGINADNTPELKP